MKYLFFSSHIQTKFRFLETLENTQGTVSNHYLEKLAELKEEYEKKKKELGLTKDLNKKKERKAFLLKLEKRIQRLADLYEESEEKTPEKNESVYTLEKETNKEIWNNLSDAEKIITIQRKIKDIHWEKNPTPAMIHREAELQKILTKLKTKRVIEK